MPCIQNTKLQLHVVDNWISCREKLLHNVSAPIHSSKLKYSLKINSWFDTRFYGFTYLKNNLFF